MDELVTALQNILATNAFMSNLTALIPAIGVLLVFAFTYRIVRKMIKGAQRGKASI